MVVHYRQGSRVVSAVTVAMVEMEAMAGLAAMAVMFGSDTSRLAYRNQYLPPLMAGMAASDSQVALGGLLGAGV
ncbi:hypothetical protein [Photorhabdus temperata]|uniref:hypothetical protein n=1 Tax=Photorhabdus temperata TaxID=574560 RepID=UPI00038A40A5|nr:hypothetical protein [Photorhabdus temperata]EQB98687.1 hypothetical protein B738_23133 [Photorhabdus temperata subsp. temperata M1021]